MALIEDLRQAAPHIPESHQPTVAELRSVVGALIAHVEHGDRLFAAAEGGFDDVAKLWTEPEPEPEPAPQTAAEPEAVAATPSDEPAAPTRAFGVAV